MIVTSTPKVITLLWEVLISLKLLLVTKTSNISICGCENGGTCVDGSFSYSCICPSNYYGSHCQCKYNYFLFTWGPIDLKTCLSDRGYQDKHWTTLEGTVEETPYRCCRIFFGKSLNSGRWNIVQWNVLHEDVILWSSKKRMFWIHVPDYAQNFLHDFQGRSNFWNKISLGKLSKV